MKKLFIMTMTIVPMLILTSCIGDINPSGSETQTQTQQSTASYHMITADEAKLMMDDENAIVIDVREEYEYNESHIPNAKLVPLGSIESDISNVVPQKDTLILVYCRSGNRSKTAAEKLVSMGYTNVYEFGGIIDWPYEVIE